MAAPTVVTREQYLESIDRIVSRAKEMGNRYNLTQLTWQPAGGEAWSIYECFDHLTLSIDVYLAAIEAAVLNARTGGAADRLRASGLIATKLLASLEPPVRRKFGAPSKIRPRPTLNPEKILPDFLEATNRLGALVKSTAGKDLSSVKFRNPLIPLLRFTVSSGFLIAAAHGRRHLWQAEQIPNEPDFPKS
jgi:hypothetical protein